MLMKMVQRPARNRSKRLVLALTGGMGCLLVLLAFTAWVKANLEVTEATLNPLGWAFELNPDAQDLLWISDYDAGEIWGLYPKDGFFEIYHVGGAPSDARHNGEYLWWADGEANILGRVSTQDGTYTRWQVPGVAGFFGTALDPQGRFWAIDFDRPYLYYLEPAAGELCTYTLPAEGMSSYLVSDAVSVWLGDYVNGRVLRLRTTDDHMDWWTLPEDSTPFGMALDQEESLWYADSTRGSLVRLDPDSGQLNSYVLPYGNLPAMLSIQGGRVWYSEQWAGSVGVLEPGLASASVYTATMSAQTLSPSCTGITPSSSGTMLITVESLDWFTTTYTSTVDSGGWQAYQLPEGALPWGIAATNLVWVVDGSRQVLAGIPLPAEVTACKVEDLDRDPLTTADQVPVENWMIYLSVDGTRQEPGQLTGSDGCTTWTDLALGITYGVVEDSPSGWTALTPISHTFGTLLSGQVVSYIFINAEEVAVDYVFIYLPMVVRNPNE
jgi:streptogramin lyase